jgi:hypothetical protein
MKFKIGDTVEVVGAYKPEEDPLMEDFKIGHRGKVIGYDAPNAPHQYLVKKRDSTCSYFNVKELKLIRKGTK